MFWRRFFYEWMYLRSPPWDSGTVPPEVVSFVSRHPPGKAIDLGCGTGTNAIYLAQHGWQVVGVDFSRKALWIAKRKGDKHNVSARFIHDDVSNLKKVRDTFDLVLDVGCFHSLSPIQKQRYLQRLRQLLNSNGHFLLYGFIQCHLNQPSIQSEDIRLIRTFLMLLEEKIGEDKGRLAAWYMFQRTTTALLQSDTY